MWNTVFFPSLGISIYEIMCSFLHSTYRYMKHCVDSVIQHIDIWNIVLMSSFNISIYEALSWFFHSGYRYMKHCVDYFIQHIDIWNIESIPSFSISIYETLCWCLHSTYRYMKHCLDSFIHHIDTRNSVLNTSGNSHMRYVFWSLSAASPCMKHVESFSRYIDICNVLWTF